MYKKIKRLFRVSSLILSLHAKIQRIRYNRVKNEMTRRTQLNIFNFREIAQPVAMLYIDKYPENNLYGMSYVISTLIGNKTWVNMNGYIEHGLFFGNYVARCSYEYNTKYIITFGKYREEILFANDNVVKKGKKVLAIGPYIAYASPLCDEEVTNSIRKELGKTLLVFPTHSIENMTTDFDNDQFVQEIEIVRQQNNFETVLVSMYWKDILDKQDLCDEYLKLGYRIVCSGHKNDIYFLLRQRTIIDLADVTMSNEVGTHVGYCIYCNKPHYVFEQSVSYKEDIEKIIKVEKMNRDLLMDQAYNKSIVQKAFSKYSETISDEQKRIVDYYWGISNVNSNMTYKISDIL